MSSPYESWALVSRRDIGRGPTASSSPTCRLRPWAAPPAGPPAPGPPRRLFWSCLGFQTQVSCFFTSSFSEGNRKQRHIVTVLLVAHGRVVPALFAVGSKAVSSWQAGLEFCCCWSRSGAKAPGWCSWSGLKRSLCGTMALVHFPLCQILQNWAQGRQQAAPSPGIPSVKGGEGPSPVGFLLVLGVSGSAARGMWRCLFPASPSLFLKCVSTQGNPPPLRHN